MNPRMGTDGSPAEFRSGLSFRVAQGTLASFCGGDEPGVAFFCLLFLAKQEK